MIEYKGRPYEANDDSKEKMNVGELWESKSKDRDIYKQIEDKISGK